MTARDDMKKAIRCLAVELHETVQKDVAAKFQAFEDEIDTEREALEAAYTKLQNSYDSLDAERSRLYTDRNLCVALLLRMCASNRWRIGTAPSPRPAPGFSRIALIETPEGQIGWHFPDSDQPLFDTVDKVFGEFPEPFDGHHHDEKFERMRKIVAKIDQINTQMLGEKVAAKAEGN